ncbi:hypothetical protein PG984_011507 [Apiospora sp. TS-2023a]
MASLSPIQNANQRSIVAIVVLFSILPTTVVGLRLWARRISGQRIRWSDGFIILDNITLLVYWAFVLFIVFAGGVDTLPDLDKLASMPESQARSFLLGNTLTQLLFSFTVFLLKFSALAFFHELFWTVSSAARRVLNVLTYLTVVCATAGIIGSFYTSFPVYGTDNATGDDLFKLKVNGRFNFIATVVLDFAIFLVPIWQLYRVRIDSRKKRDIILAFGLGFLTCVVALVRISLWWQKWFQQNMILQWFLLGLEPSVGIVAVSVPLLRPIFHRPARNPDNVRMHRLPSRAKAVSPEDGIITTTTFELSSRTSRPS